MTYSSQTSLSLIASRARHTRRTQLSGGEREEGGGIEKTGADLSDVGGD